MATLLTEPAARLVEYALDGLSIRHAAIASNVANMRTPGYRQVSVTFEPQLADAIAALRTRSPGAVHVPQLPAPQFSLGGLVGGTTTAQTSEGNLIALNQNAIRYQMLIAGLEKLTAPIALAASDGRR
jgi:flagellar basal-body rod protein FlgB